MVRTKTAKGVLAAAASLLFFACGSFSDFGIPESVSVKSNARYVGALGKKYYDLSEKFGDDFVADLEKNAGGDVYKYIPDPNDNTLKYLLHKKVYDVPLDASKYIDSMELDKTISSEFAFSKEFALPEVKQVEKISVPAGASSGSYPFDIVINLTLDEAIKSAVIGQGGLVLRAEGSGATIDVASFTLDGITKNDDSPFSETDFNPSSEAGSFLINQKLDLANAKLVFPVTQIRAQGELSLTSGTVAAASQIVCSFYVDTLSSASADLADVGGFVMDNTTENKTKVSAEMVAYVQTIYFGEQSGSYYYKHDAAGAVTTKKCEGKGLKFKAINSFPAGNDIELVIKSTTFGIDSTGGIYSNGEPAASAKIEGKANDGEFNQSFAAYSDIDVTDNSKFGTKDNPEYIRFSVELSHAQAFSNLEMGKTYKIAVSEAEMLFDWDKIDIDLSSADPVEDAADLSDFSIDKMMSEVDGELSKLMDNCDFKSVPVYFFVQKPTGSLAADIGDISIDGKIYLEYKDSSSVVQPPKYIAGTNSSTETMEICDAVDWPSTDKPFTKVFAQEGKDYSFDYDFAETLNERPVDLAVNYSMGITGGASCSFYKARFDSLGKDDVASIAVEMAAVLPINMFVTKNTDLDVYKLGSMDMDDETDLMHRDSVSDTETFAKYSGAISYLRLNYNFINSAVEGFNATVTVNDKHEGEAGADKYSGIVRSVEITGNDSSDDVIDFTGEEIAAALTHFFMPKMTMTVKKGELKVRRDALESESSLGINPVVVLQLNENVAVDITDIIKN